MVVLTDFMPCFFGLMMKIKFVAKNLVECKNRRKVIV